MLTQKNRVELIDALRAFALIGIAQINVQSFLWGATDPLGYFNTEPRWIDTAVYLLAGTFISVKFITLFAFLFGVGFAFQVHRLRTGQPLAEAKAAYRRRLWFLLAIGLAHGVLLYYGDILAFYAICGFLLLLFAGTRLRMLVTATVVLLIAHVVLTLLSTALYAVPLPDEALHALDIDPHALPPDAQALFSVFTQAGFVQQIGPRAEEYAVLLGTMLFFAIPQVLSLFVLGAIAARLGWLTHPQRHPRVWRVATWAGLVALPIGVTGSWLSYQNTLDAPGLPSLLGYALQTLSAPIAGLYVALAVRAQQQAWGQRAIRWLAPAGRMPLTNYLMQSVLMGALLSGWGLGLGASLQKADLAALALAIVVLQLVASRWWIARFGQGPVEAMWRRVTYRTPSAGSAGR